MSRDKTWREEPPDLLEQLEVLADDAPREEVERVFLEVLERIPPGQQFTVNDVRARLDAMRVPNRMRGALFGVAKSAGIIEPIRVTSWRMVVDVAEPSTGKSAHSSFVRRYRRPAPLPSTEVTT